MTQKNALIVFIKTPVPNQVKTRLQPQISGKDSARLYRAFLRDIDKRFNKNDSFDCWYAISPENYDKKKLNELVDLSNSFLQKGSDLGERMANAFQYLFNQGYEKIVLMGSDVPTLTVDIIEESYKLLKTSDCILGPGFDGGYYLIGMTKLYPNIFKSIAWSTSRVFETTMAILAENRISVNTLNPMRDIDTFKELKELYQELQEADKESADFPSHTWEVVQKLKM